jgi:prepilin-type N-terminal cleavage/methylation domain-containing protein
MIKKKSFTLIEVLIATSIIAIVAASLYSAFYTGILSYRKLDAEFETYQTARVILNRLEADLKNSFAYTEADPKFFGQKDFLEFFNVINIYSSGKSYPAVCRVKYELEGRALKRSYFPGLRALASEAEPVSEELTSSIQGISFEYALGLDRPDNPYLWQEAWSEEQIKKTPLPLAVKVKLSLAGGTSRDKVSAVEFVKIIPLAPGEKSQALNP